MDFVKNRAWQSQVHYGKKVITEIPVITVMIGFD